MQLGKVKVDPPPTENLERYKAGANVTIKTKDGRTYTNTVYAPRGAAILGIAWDDIENKYRALAPYAKFSGGNLAATMQVVRNFRNVKKVSELTGLLR